MMLRLARLTLALVLFVDLGCSNFIRTGWQPDIAVRPSTAIVVWAAPALTRKTEHEFLGFGSTPGRMRSNPGGSIPSHSNFPP